MTASLALAGIVEQTQTRWRCVCGNESGRMRPTPIKGALAQAAGVRVVYCKACGHGMAVTKHGLRNLTPDEATRIEKHPGFRKFMAAMGRKFAHLWG